MMMNKEYALPIAVYVATVFILIAIVYVGVNLYFKADLLANPCEKCCESNEYYKCPSVTYTNDIKNFAFPAKTTS